MPYYASIKGSMMAIVVGDTVKEAPIGDQLLDFVYYDLKKFKHQLDKLLAQLADSEEPVTKDIFSQIDEENIYLHFFAELLLEILADNDLKTKSGFDEFCDEFAEEMKSVRQVPFFAKTDYKTAGVFFWKSLVFAHALIVQEQLKDQLEFCMNSSNDKALRGLQPMQRLFLLEQWNKSNGDKGIYFEGELFSTRILMDKTILFPKGGSLNDWAELLKKEDPTILEMTELPNGHALLRYEMMHMVMQDVQIKLCANCGRYFINTGRSDKEYCPRPIDGQPDKTCEAVGALLKHQNKAKNSAIIQEYNTAYKRANSNKRIGNLTEKEFKAWSIQAREKRDLCLEGKITQDEFVEWLNQDRIYKKRS